MSHTSDSDIPTLTDVITPGDETMAGHFDKSLLQQTTAADEVEVEVEEETELEPDSREPTLDMDGLTQLNVDDEDRHNTQEPEQAQRQLDADSLQDTIIHQLVDDTLEAVMPALEDQLRDRLTKTLQSLVEKQLRR